MLNQREAVQVLLDRGSAVNLQDRNGGTALFYAAADGRFDLVQLLLTQHADPKLTLANGETALDAARERQHSKVVNLLLGLTT
jgi:uncharacterized protein